VNKMKDFFNNLELHMFPINQYYTPKLFFDMKIKTIYTLPKLIV
jgi:hypothetical protein